MSVYRRGLLIALGAIAGVAAIVLGSFVLYRWARQGEVLGAVTVSSVPLGGMSEQDAISTLLDLEATLAGDPATFNVNGSDFDLIPLTVGFELDEQAILDTAMTIGREGTLWNQFRWWLASFSQTYALPLVGSLDSSALGQVVARWEVDSGMTLPYNGGIEIEGTAPVADYPRLGMGIDRTGLDADILSLFLEEQRPTVTLPVNVLRPSMTDQDIDRGLAHARKLLSGPVTLERTDPEVSVTFSVQQLADAFFAQVVSEPQPRLTIGFDANRIDRVLAPIRADLEAPPRDAEFEVDDDDAVLILPSRPGTLVDASLAAEAVEEAAGSFARLGEFPFEDGAQPAVSTADLEVMRVEHLVSQFTTYHGCCECRVNNIHLIADEIDGALVPPGSDFSVNEHVGERTAAEGYCLAGTIIGGELQDTIGGGVSQFATTFYNAVFWGGFEDVDHKPHSLYFSRYPEGIEGTISWPEPHLIFHNDTDGAVLIKTDYTDRSITVKFFGSNDGRTVIGEQTGGKTILEVTPGGPEARIVEAELSPRYNFRTTRPIYIADPERDPDSTEVEGSKGRGWSVDVTRRITYPDGTVTEQNWVVRYTPPIQRITTHPCNIPEGESGYTGEECPEPTTTTIEGGSTSSTSSTTTVPATTTTTSG